jgi:uncharacterized iron-regulated membrane protein
MSADVPATRHRVLSARKIWQNVHLWLGLLTGLVLSLIGLTGAILAFYHPLLKAEVGYRYFKVDGPPSSHPSIDEWIAGARQAYGEFGRVSFVMGPGYSLALQDAANLGIEAPDGRRSTITVDTSNGRPIGHFEWSGLLLPFSFVTGLLLWLDKRRNRKRLQ